MKVFWPIYNLATEYGQYPGVMSIAAVLRARGFPSEVVPADAAVVARKLERSGPAVLAFSTPTPYFRAYQRLAAEVGRSFPGVVRVFGGPHATYFPEIIDENGVDAVCVGEGEEAMAELVARLAAGAPVDDVPNFWVKRPDGSVRRNPPRPLIEDLDALPVPDHAVFRRAMARDVTQALVITGRGCPHRCTYCYNHVYRRLYRGKGKVVRRRSVAHVMEELRALRRTSCTFVRFVDDLFILDDAWVERFARAYRRDIGLPFSCLVRANLVTEPVMRLLREAGCYRVIMGLEAGNDHVRREVLGRPMSSETIVHAARIVREAGIKLVTANIVAIPGGSFEADWDTLALNWRCKPDYASVQILTPFPRTDIHRRARELGMLTDQTVATLEQTLSFCRTSPLRFADPREQRRSENLHKFFATAARFPALAPLVRRLLDLPHNRLYDALYLLALNAGIHLVLVPPSVGLPMLARKLARAARVWKRNGPSR